MDEWLKEGHRVLVIPNLSKQYEKYGNTLMCLGNIVVKKDIPFAENCRYHDQNTNEIRCLTIPLRLLWVVVDNQNLEDYYFTSPK